MAATMGYARVADLAHRMENLLDHLRRGAGGRRAADDVLQLLFRATDALEKAIQLSAAGREREVNVTGIVAELDRAGQRFAPDTTPRHSTPAAAPEPPPAVDAGPGRRVRVTLRPEAPLKGPRALIVLKRAEGLGKVSQIQPPPAQLEAEEFEGQFSFWLAGVTPADRVVATLLPAGDVEAVAVDEEGVPAARLEAGAIASRAWCATWRASSASRWRSGSRGRKSSWTAPSSTSSGIRSCTCCATRSITASRPRRSGARPGRSRRGRSCWRRCASGRAWRSASPTTAAASTGRASSPRRRPKGWSTRTSRR